MNTNQRFAISIHALTLLAANSRPLTSEYIASSVDTNPVVIRRTMADLRRHGLVRSKPGVNGGWRLVRAAEKIPLHELYRILGEDDVLAIHSHPNRHCPVGKNIKGALTGVFASVREAMLEALGEYTIADVLQNVKSHW